MPNASCPEVGRLTESRLPCARVLSYPSGCRQALRHTAGCPSGQRERSVKPSAQPTLVRTQHLPPPAETAPGLRKRGPAGRFLLVTPCIRVRHYGSMHGSVRVHMVYSVRAKLAVRITARFRDLVAVGHAEDIGSVSGSAVKGPADPRHECGSSSWKAAPDDVRWTSRQGLLTCASTVFVLPPSMSVHAYASGARHELSAAPGGPFIGAACAASLGFPTYRRRSALGAGRAGRGGARSRRPGRRCVW
jgi:hypothetical protein